MIENLSGEKWSPIKNYENKYLISNYGRVKTIPNYKTPERLVPSFIYKDYECVTLMKNSAKRMKPVHRLVAEAFIPNPNHFPNVYHLNGKKTNNVWTNLAWCSMYFNNIKFDKLEGVVTKDDLSKLCEENKIEFTLKDTKSRQERFLLFKYDENEKLVGIYNNEKEGFDSLKEIYKINFFTSMSYPMQEFKYKYKKYNNFSFLNYEWKKFKFYE